MADLVVRKILRELRDIIESEETAPCGIKVEMISNANVFDLRGEIKGPPGTPYEGGTFVLEFVMPRNYPSKPPLISFVTKIWHPNICPESGIICLDVLQQKWSTSLTLRTILLSIQVLLSSPEPEDPQDLEVGSQFRENPEMFDLTARYWTNVYAGGSSKNQEFDDKVTKLIKLGVPEDYAREVLSGSNWNLESAIREIRSFNGNSQNDDCSNEEDKNKVD